MEIVKSTEDRALEAAIAILKKGGVVLHHTDTCYGLACNACDEKSLKRLCEIKKMSMNKPVSVLVDSMEMAAEYGVFGEWERMWVEKYWPGALTVIVERKAKLPNFLNPGLSTVGMRWPDHQFCLGLVGGLGFPVATTSANVSGLPEVYDIGDFLVQVVDDLKPDLIVDDGLQLKKMPSTIVDLSQGSAKLVRQGDLLVDCGAARNVGWR